MNRLIIATAAGAFGVGALLTSTGASATASSQAVAAKSATIETPRAATANISISSNMRFSKATVSPGGKVRVTNFDNKTHTVTANNGSFNVRVRAGKSKTFTAPSAAGTYRFHCNIHPEMMGRLKVKA